MAKDISLKLKEGDEAPAFTASTNGGGTIALAPMLPGCSRIWWESTVSPKTLVAAPLVLLVTAGMS
mgnify:CR=1 FL=1